MCYAITDTCPDCGGIMDVAINNVAPVARAGLLAEGKAEMVCLECGYIYQTTDEAAQAFEQDGCPKCGSMDMDINTSRAVPVDNWHVIDDDEWETVTLAEARHLDDQLAKALETATFVDSHLESAYEERFELQEA